MDECMGIQKQFIEAKHHIDVQSFLYVHGENWSRLPFFAGFELVRRAARPGLWMKATNHGSSKA